MKIVDVPLQRTFNDLVLNLINAFWKKKYALWRIFKVRCHIRTKKILIFWCNFYHTFKAYTFYNTFSQDGAIYMFCSVVCIHRLVEWHLSVGLVNRRSRVRLCSYLLYQIFKNHNFLFKMSYLSPTLLRTMLSIIIKLSADLRNYFRV